MYKVIFLGNGSKYSKDAENILKNLNCEIVKLHNKNIRFKDYPDEYDLGVSFLYPYLVLSNEVNKLPWINFHPAPLPRYGGRNLMYNAIMNDEFNFGGTIHFMNKYFDKGGYY